MDLTAFWKLIDDARDDSLSNIFKQAELLTYALEQLPEEDILMYESILLELMDKAYIVELWEAAYIIGCGCSDDGFVDFRGWLIGQGEEIYEKALTDPDSLVDVVEIGGETQEGNLQYVAAHAYENKTGKTMPPISYNPPQLQGELSLDEQSVITRFPKLTEKFWMVCDREFIPK